MSAILRLLGPVLAAPALYQALQSALGASRLRSHFVNEVARISKGQSILDLGCGPADILGHLPEVDYTGVDISAAYIAQARSRWGDRGRFIVGGAEAFDAFDIPPVDVVMGFGLLHHLDDIQAAAMLSRSRNVLKPGGVLATVDPCLVPGQSPVARWLISNDRGEYVRSAESYAALVAPTFSEHVSATVRHDLLTVPYTHILMTCRAPDSAPPDHAG